VAFDTLPGEGDSWPSSPDSESGNTVHPGKRRATPRDPDTPERIAEAEALALCSATWLAQSVGAICPWDRVVVWLARHEAQVYTPVESDDPQVESGWKVVTRTRAALLAEEINRNLHVGSAVPLQAQQATAVLLEPVA